MMTIEEALDLIDETGLMLRRHAVVCEGEQETRAVAGADVCEQLAAAIRDDDLKYQG